MRIYWIFIICLIFISPSGCASGNSEIPTPNAPSDLVATAVSSSQIDIAWTDNSDNEDGFKIERLTEMETASGGWQKTEYIEIAVVGHNITSYSDAGLLHGSYYRYRINACNQAGDSECFEKPKNEDILLSIQKQIPPNTEIDPGFKKYILSELKPLYVNETEVYTLPCAPINLTATAVSYKEIRLIWTNVSNHYGITNWVERSTDGINYEGFGLSTGSSTEDTWLEPNTTYYYRVIAHLHSGKSPYSNVASVITRPLSIAYAISQAESLYQAHLITDTAFYTVLIKNLNDAQSIFDSGNIDATVAKLEAVKEQIWSGASRKEIDWESAKGFVYYMTDLSLSIGRGRH